MRIVMLAIGALVMAPQSAAAEPKTGAPQVEDAHADLYQVMRNGIDREAALDNLVAEFAAQLAVADANVAMLEARNPGLMVEIGEAMRPIFRSYTQRVERQYAPRMIALLRESLTADEAIEVATFYRSEIGQTLLRSVSAQADQRAGLADSIAQRDVSAESVLQDNNRTAGRALLSLSPEQLQELEAAAAATPALAKLDDYQVRSVALQTEMQNTPVTKEEEAELIRAIEETIARRVGDD